MRSHMTQDIYFSGIKKEIEEISIKQSLISCDVVTGFNLDSRLNTSETNIAVKTKKPKAAKCSVTIKEDEWFNSEEAAAYLKVSKKTLLNMTSSGAIPYCKLGRSNRYNKAALNRLLLDNKRGVNYGY